MLVASLIDWHSVAGYHGCLFFAGILVGFLIVHFIRSRSPRLLPGYAMASNQGGPRRRSGKSLLFETMMDRRESLRRRGQRVKVRLADAAGLDSLGTAWIVDRSTGGLGLISERPLAIGRVITLRPVHATNRMPGVEMEVKCCRDKGTSWELGCRFLQQPSWNMRVLFG